MRTHERITLEMSLMDMMIALAEGNPGAITALIELVKSEPIVDPDNIWKGMGCLMSLDTLGIYGPGIWVLYNDACDRNARKVHVLLRAWGLGFLPTNELLGYANRNGSDSITHTRFFELEKQVLDFLPNFARV